MGFLCCLIYQTLPGSGSTSRLDRAAPTPSALRFCVGVVTSPSKRATCNEVIPRNCRTHSGRDEPCLPGPRPCSPWPSRALPMSKETSSAIIQESRTSKAYKFLFCFVSLRPCSVSASCHLAICKGFFKVLKGCGLCWRLHADDADSGTRSLQRETKLSCAQGGGACLSSQVLVSCCDRS